MFSLFLQDAWKVFVYGLVLGAGLPAVYALGIRSLSFGTVNAGGLDDSSSAGSDHQRHPIGVVLAVICFAVVIAGVAIGLTYIIAAGQGKQLSFDNVYPTIVPKS